MPFPVSIDGIKCSGVVDGKTFSLVFLSIPRLQFCYVDGGFFSLQIAHTRYSFFFEVLIALHLYMHLMAILERTYRAKFN